MTPLVEHRYTIGRTERMTRPAAMAFCRETYGDQTAEQLRAYLVKRGFVVSESTVRRWGDPTHYEAKRVQERDVARVRRQERRIFGRMTRLRSRRLTFGAIAAVLSEDHGVEVTTEQVRYSMGIGRLSRELRQAVLA